MSEAEVSTNSAPIDAELSGIRSTMGNPGAAYWRDGEVTQERYRALAAAKQSGVPVPAKPSSVAAELASIKAEMVPGGRYWKEPALQDRYGALLMAQVAEPAKPEPNDPSRALSLAQWREAGRDEGHYGLYLQSVSATNDVLQRLSADAGMELTRSFSALPEGARAGAITALIDRRPVAPEAVDEAALEALGADLPALSKEWGSASRQKLGKAMARVWRAVDAIEDEPARALLRWVGNLPPAAAAAVMRRLAG